MGAPGSVPTEAQRRSPALFPLPVRIDAPPSSTLATVMNIFRVCEARAESYEMNTSLK